MSFNRSGHGLLFSLLFTSALCAPLAIGACGGVDPSTGTGGSGSTTASTTGSGGAGGNSTTTATTGVGGGSVSCGNALVCDPGAVCIVEDFEEPCSALAEDGGTCAPGEHMSMCGGIGYPCCCGQAPPSTFHCASPVGCGAEPSCDCLDKECPGDKMCQGIGGKPSEFHCVTPPKP